MNNMRNKILSLLVLLLTAVMGAWAQSPSKVWDFTATANDEASLRANEEWGKDETNIDGIQVARFTYYFSERVFTDMGDIGFATGAGIQVSAYNIRVDIGARIQASGRESKYKIPGLKAGDVVKIRCRSANSSESRTLTVTSDNGSPTVITAPYNTMAESTITLLPTAI